MFKINSLTPINASSYDLSLPKTSVSTEKYIREDIGEEWERRHPGVDQCYMDRFDPCERRSLFAVAEQEFPVPSNHFAVPPKIFPVRSSGEFDQKAQ